ncbi:MAG: M23 family metallopeptidase [Ignavibacteriales bacterium]|nr:MAG: M23 family metallopeptidase [Ignavibacteriales bacterium]
MKEYFKSFITKAKKYLDSVILVVPNTGTSLKRFKGKRIFILLIIYTILLLTAGFYTGVLLLPAENNLMSESDINRISNLNEKIIQLSMEVEGLKDSNRKLKNAIFLADSTLFNRKEIPSGKKKLPKEGNVFYIFKKIVENLNEIKQESYYFVKPADGFISRGFNASKGHFGIDIVLKTGNPVYSAGNGYVIFADYTTNDGYMIIIDHSDDYVTVYKHCSMILKKTRESVTQGELIALGGNTGESTGPHLHFEIWKKGVPQDPKELIIN